MSNWRTFLSRQRELAPFSHSSGYSWLVLTEVELFFAIPSETRAIASRALLQIEDVCSSAGTNEEAYIFRALAGFPRDLDSSEP